MRIPGRWRQGYALDYHTQSSVFLGYDEYGHSVFDTTRSALGELLYRLKYRAEPAVLTTIVDVVVEFVAQWQPSCDLILPVPPSKPRNMQPVQAIAHAVAHRLGMTYDDSCIVKTHATPELKNIYDYDERLQLLATAFHVRRDVRGIRVLLIDDLYRSGATLSAITDVLYDTGDVHAVYALALTRTRSRT